MIRSLLVITGAFTLAACTGSSKEADAAKQEGSGKITELRTIDYNCAATEAQDAAPFDTVNRISLDLVNNRIDMFSKDRVWQFHGVENSEAERHSISIAFIGKNVAAWGLDKSNPFTFFFDRGGKKVVFSLISNGKVQAVSYSC
ncbi:hypothetical protein [Novosphingobium sp. AAP83]|uniref:hypothetical protein n=1 Tax=Novosphingobium sp. AAP83 TaxID=1523425 RepID=UPI000A9D65CB|nr:hypothetical protein [Novosphingobium sp. AAP83]